ncbi:MAG: 30S ribosomal protein S11 [Candidatus Moeniiplasma glomeromycotorum]|nr:30S ribosomal protein S11 [Candidatus Moeniiplasma glomeromycotorum]
MAVIKKGSKKEAKPKKIKKIPEGRGIIHAKFSYNNTIFRLSKENGDIVGSQISGGTIGFRNTAKGRAATAEKTAQGIIKLAADYGINNVKLRVKNIGPGRDLAIKKILEEKSLNVEELIDDTSIPHGGCRPRKRPRK